VAKDILEEIDIKGLLKRYPYRRYPGSLPNIFRNLRIYKGMSESDLAERIGVSLQYISKVENGTYPASLKYCLKCGEVFGFNPNWVKAKWANRCTARFGKKLLKRLGVEP